MERVEGKLTISEKRPFEEEDEERNVKKVKPYNNRTILEFDIGNEYHVSAQRFQSEEVLVHIRQYDTSPTGKSYPTKRGITLPLDKWKSLTEEYMDEVDKAFQDVKDGKEKVFYKQHLGENIHVTVEQSYRRVDIRKWWLPKDADVIKPTKSGVSMSEEMWREFKKTIPELQKELRKELDNVRYCYLDHDNQMSMLECRSCNLNEWKDYL
jgi:hypothetical protein